MSTGYDSLRLTKDCYMTYNLGQDADNQNQDYSGSSCAALSTRHPGRSDSQEVQSAFQGEGHWSHPC